MNLLQCAAYLWLFIVLVPGLGYLMVKNEFARIFFTILLGVILTIGALAVVTAHADEPLRVAVIDTGLDLKDPRFTPVLCPFGHTDVSGDADIEDKDGHGTHVTGIIKQYAGDSGYCLLIIKYWTAKSKSTLLKAIQTAVALRADFVNISSSGPGFEEREFNEMRDAKDITWVAAAGNEGKPKAYFPAGYSLPNVISVGSIDMWGKRAPDSNYGPWVKVSERGENVYSTLPGGQYGYKSGTSMATAIRTGKLVKERLNAQVH